MSCYYLYTYLNGIQGKWFHILEIAIFTPNKHYLYIGIALPIKIITVKYKR